MILVVYSLNGGELATFVMRVHEVKRGLELRQALKSAPLLPEKLDSLLWEF
jgi:hypothetical protein